MISGNHANPAFCGINPIKVLIDGKEATDPANIKRASRALTKILAGPTENSNRSLNIAMEFAKGDKDYSFTRGLKGYLKMKGDNISDFFRCINNGNKYYIATGEQAQKLKENGKKLGLVRKMQNQYGIKDSFELQATKENYGSILRKYLSAPHLQPKINGKPVTLKIETSSSGTYGKKNFKLQIEKIDWI